MLIQTQRASQTARTVQVDDGGAPLAGNSEAAPAAPEKGTAGIVEEGEQRIWQLQIGCLMHCVDTKMRQEAVQSPTTVTVPRGASSHPSAVAPAHGEQTQLVTQVQIGCLSWCFDSSELQLATVGDSPGAREVDGSNAGTSSRREAATGPSRPGSSSSAPATSAHGADPVARDRPAERVTGAVPRVTARVATRTFLVTSDSGVRGMLVGGVTTRCWAPAHAHASDVSGPKPHVEHVDRRSSDAVSCGCRDSENHRPGAVEPGQAAGGRTCETCGSSSDRFARRPSQREDDHGLLALRARRPACVCRTGRSHPRPCARRRSCDRSSRNAQARRGRQRLPHESTRQLGASSPGRAPDQRARQTTRRRPPLQEPRRTLQSSEGPTVTPMPTHDAALTKRGRATDAARHGRASRVGASVRERLLPSLSGPYLPLAIEAYRRDPAAVRLARSRSPCDHRSHARGAPAAARRLALQPTGEVKAAIASGFAALLVALCLAWVPASRRR